MGGRSLRTENKALARVSITTPWPLPPPTLTPPSRPLGPVWAPCSHSPWPRPQVNTMTGIWLTSRIVRQDWLPLTVSREKTGRFIAFQSRMPARWFWEATDRKKEGKKEERNKSHQLWLSLQLRLRKIHCFHFLWGLLFRKSPFVMSQGEKIPMALPAMFFYYFVSTLRSVSFSWRLQTQGSTCCFSG